jgi:probable rRNA maturation factor
MRGKPGQSTPSHRCSRLSAEIVERSGHWSGAGMTHADLIAAAEAAYAAGAAAAAGEVAIVLSDDKEVRRLNRTWAGKDRATDVLSFPDDSSGDGADALLGDIVLAYETVARDAAQLGIPVAAHASHLVVHGMLHLLGYDHGTESEAAAMEGLETEVLASLGLHDPYGSRAENHALGL